MSRITELAAEDVKKSSFIFNDNHTIEVRDAVFIWTNFSGEPNKFGNTDKYFNLVLNEEAAHAMKDIGFNVREFDNGEEMEKTYFVNVKVKMDSAFPPQVSLYSEFKGKRTKQVLDETTIGNLDRINIESADCIINAYTNATTGKVSGYLRKLNVIQKPDIEFGGKYDEWLDEPQTPDDDIPFDI